MKATTRQVPEYTYECDYCGRTFTSQGGWAHDAATECERECLEHQAAGEVRVFLPPVGRWDTMFRDRYWQFVPADSVQAQCAAQGHDVVMSWGCIRLRGGEATPGVHLAWQEQDATCTRCGVTHRPYQTPRRDVMAVRCTCTFWDPCEICDGVGYVPAEEAP